VPPTLCPCRFRHQLWEPLGAQRPVFSFQALASAQSAPELDLGFENRRNARIVPGLLDEVARPTAHGFHGQLDRAPGGHDDHRQGAVQVLNPRQQIQAFLP